MTKEEGMKELCTLAAAWYGNSKQHAVFAAYCKWNGYNTLAEKFQEESEGEWKEANDAMNRLVELGCKPADLAEGIKTIEFPFFDEPKDMLMADLEGGTDESAIKMMSEMLGAFADDYITQKLIQDWIVDEKEHIDWNRQHRQLIEKVGYDNYLLEML